MKGVVDDSLAGGPAVIIIDGSSHASAPHLAGKWNNGRCAAARSGNRAATEIVGHHRATAERLINMAMSVNAARKYKATTGIDLRLA